MGADSTYTTGTFEKQGGAEWDIGNGTSQPGKLVINAGGTFDATSAPAVNMLESTTDGLTALAGGGQAGATPVTSVINRFSTVATNGDSGLLPASVAGAAITVINSGAASLNVFPATGETINALSANSAFAIASGKTATFYCAVAGKWHAVLSA
jgi:hypothetical protein